MKFSFLTTLLLFASATIQISAQESEKTDTVAMPGASREHMELLGMKLKTADKTAPLKKRANLKIDLAMLLQKGLGLEVEVPINLKSRFAFRSGWIPMNRKFPYHSPGTYQNTYINTYTETTIWLFGLGISSSSTTISPEPFPEVGEFLPTSMVPLQASIRTYIGKKERGIRFFIQPGIRVLLFKGMHIEDYQTMLSQTTTIVNNMSYSGGTYSETTTTTFQQTRTASAGAKRTVFGLESDFGCRFSGKRRMIFDLGIRTGWNDSKGIFGLKRMYLTPLLNFGFRI